jgi:methionine biosynthesis protein MetW
VLSRTLQAVRDVERVMDEILRVGRQCIVTFPNFAYHKLRRMLADDGRAPVAGVLSYQWYDSPNIRFLSIDDFQSFCDDKGIEVHKRVALDTEADREVTDDPNRNADLAIFVLSR